MSQELRSLTRQFPQTGKLEAIFLRPERRVDVIRPQQAIALEGAGLQGDRAAFKAKSPPSKRQVTLIQAEHLPVIAAFMGAATIDAGLLRRNLVISGINLMAAKSLFKDQPVYLKIGAVLLQITGPCEPCSRMEELLGPGGYNALRGHGGFNAQVLQGGLIALGDQINCALT